MKIAINLNPNNIECIRYKVDDETSLLLTFDTESSDNTPTIKVIPSLKKEKEEEERQTKLINTKFHFKEILDKAKEIDAKWANESVNKLDSTQEAIESMLKGAKQLKQEGKSIDFLSETTTNKDCSDDTARFEDKVYKKYKNKIKV